MGTSFRSLCREVRVERARIGSIKKVFTK